MYGYISGTIKEINSAYVIIDNNGIGYMVYVPNPYAYQLNKDYVIYIYTHVREEEYSLYGFKDREEKELFLKLISVKGLGPKMAVPIIAMGSTDRIAEAIENNDLAYLKKFPKIGEKVAKQMVLDLKGKLNYIGTGIFARENFNSELLDVLVGLGYKQADIKKIITKVDDSKTLEEQLKEALRLLLK